MQKGFALLLGIIIVVAIIAAGFVFLSNSAVQDINTYKSVKETINQPALPKQLASSAPNTSSEEKAISGYVIQNNLGCTMGQRCYLTIRGEHGIYDVTYSQEGEDCNEKYVSVGKELNTGEQVEINGGFSKLIGTICGSDNYYLKKI